MALEKSYLDKNSSRLKKIGSKEDFVDILFEQAIKFIKTDDIKDSSKLTYKRGLKSFFVFLKTFNWDLPFRKEIILEYKSYLKNKALSPLTINLYLVTIRQFFVYLESEKIYPDVAKDVKSLKKSAGFSRDALSLSQVKELLSSIPKSNTIEKRDYAIINLMIRTGLRTFEVINANIGDIRRVSDNFLLYIQGKGRDTKDNFVVLTEETLAPINDYLKVREDRDKLDENTPLFISESDRNKGEGITTKTLRRIIKSYLKKIGIDSKRVSAHSLRHTFATIALKNGAPLEQVKEAMRHKSITTTQIYLHIDERIEKGAEKYIKI